MDAPANYLHRGFIFISVPNLDPSALRSTVRNMNQTFSSVQPALNQKIKAVKPTQKAASPMPPAGVAPCKVPTMATTVSAPIKAATKPRVNRVGLMVRFPYVMAWAARDSAACVVFVAGVQASGNRRRASSLIAPAARAATKATTTNSVGAGDWPSVASTTSTRLASTKAIDARDRNPRAMSNL